LCETSTANKASMGLYRRNWTVSSELLINAEMIAQYTNDHGCNNSTYDTVHKHNIAVKNTT